MPLDRQPPKPFSSLDVAFEEWWPDVPRFGLRWRHLSRAGVGDDYRVGVAIEELAPGMQSVPAHYHIFEEEHLFVLEGALSLRLGAATFPMKVGDYVCFPAGQKAGHCLLNEGDTPCRYVIVGERNPNEVAVYTDSRKVLVRALGRRALFDLDATRTYWDGEDSGLPPGATQEKPVRIGTEPIEAPHPPISSDAVPWDEAGTGPVFGGRSKHLTFAALGRPDYRVGVLIEAPAPGMRLAPRHYHMLEEEHALILEGEVTLLLGEERLAMRPGDYACFPAGQRIGHSFLNSGGGPCRILMIGENNPNEVCVYPDSNKIMVRALQMQDDIFDMSAVRRYWDGEAAG